MGLGKERRLQGKQHQRSWSSARFQPKSQKGKRFSWSLLLPLGGFLTEKPKSPSLLHTRRIAVTFKANPAQQHFPASRAAKAERLLLRSGGTTSILCRLLSRNSSVRGVPLPPAGTTPPQEGPSLGPAVTRALPGGNGMPTKSALNFSLHLLVRLPKVLNNKSAYLQPWPWCSAAKWKAASAGGQPVKQYTQPLERAPCPYRRLFQLHRSRCTVPIHKKILALVDSLA